MRHSLHASTETPTISRRPGVECILPWTTEARFSAERFEHVFEMLAETSSRFRIWLVPMHEDRTPWSACVDASFEAARDALSRWSQTVAWKWSGQSGLDRLHQALDLENPTAIRVIADFSRAFRASDLAEALIAGKRRPTEFGIGSLIAVRIDQAEALASPAISEASIVSKDDDAAARETGTAKRRLRPLGKILRAAAPRG